MYLLPSGLGELSVGSGVGSQEMGPKELPPRLFRTLEQV